VLLSAISNDSDALQKAKQTEQQMEQYTAQAGIKQLQPDNADVAALNALMQQQQTASALEYLNIYSRDDDVVPVTSADWPSDLQVELSGTRHAELLLAPPGSSLRAVLAVAFGDAPITRAAIDRALAPPPSS
jgi:hypothetical protein